jgi:DNA-binding transcriptional LysR family regulator
MELTLTRSFLAVAETGSITQAADQLGLTQSALSRRIQQYEEQLGARLLVRNRNGIELTEEGRLVLVSGQRLLASWNALREEIRRHQGLEGGQVRIGGGATAVSFILPPAIAAFQGAHPQVMFHMKEAGSREVAEDVANGRLELGIVTLPLQSRELQTWPLLDDDIVLVARHDHPLTHKRKLQIADLADQTFVSFEAGTALRHIIDNAAREAGLELHVVMELRSIPSILRMVSTTGQLAFVSRIALAGQQEVVELPIRSLRVRRRLAVVSRQQVQLSPAAAAFLTLLLKKDLAQPEALKAP